MNLEDPEQVVALAAELERAGYYNSPLQTLLEDVVETLVSMAKDSCISGVTDPVTAVHYNRGLMNGARAVTATLQTVRLRALTLLEAKTKQQIKERERDLPLGGGTLA